MTRPCINRILRQNPRNSRYGAPLGSRSTTDGGTDGLYLQPLRMVDGDYGADGTYWGGWSSRAGGMWCAFSADGQTRIYTRAKSRREAFQQIAEDYPGVTLRRPA